MKKEEDKDRQAVTMYKDGVPVDELCKFLRIGPDRLYAAIDAAKILRRTRSNIPRPTKEQIEEAIRLYVEGEEIDKIVVATTVSNSVLVRSLKHRDISMRDKGNRISKRRKKASQTTTNIVTLQRSHGKDFVGLCNRVLSGELDF